MPKPTQAELEKRISDLEESIRGLNQTLAIERIEQDRVKEELKRRKKDKQNPLSKEERQELQDRINGLQTSIDGIIKGRKADVKELGKALSKLK